MKRDTSTESWDEIADDWVRHADANDYRNLFLMPRTLALLGDVRGKRILDLGCGDGGYARELARRGATMTGVDGSARLIEIARERTRAAGLDVAYVVANASAMEAIETGSFDIVLAAMSLMDVEDYDAAIGETHRVLEPGGELLMSITHPCFSAPVSRWVNDGEFFAVDRYFERTAWPDKITDRFRSPVIRRHRPLEDYINGALRAGFVLRDLREPAATPDEVRASPRFEKITRVPYFLFLRWQRPA